MSLSFVFLISVCIHFWIILLKCKFFDVLLFTKEDFPLVISIKPSGQINGNLLIIVLVCVSLPEPTNSQVILCPTKYLNSCWQQICSKVAYLLMDELRTTFFQIIIIQVDMCSYFCSDSILLTLVIFFLFVYCLE